MVKMANYKISHGEPLGMKTVVIWLIVAGAHK